MFELVKVEKDSEGSPSVEKGIATSPERGDLTAKAREIAMGEGQMENIWCLEGIDKGYVELNVQDKYKLVVRPVRTKGDGGVVAGLYD